MNHILTIDVMMPPHQRPSCIPWIVIALHKGHHAAVLSDRKPFFAVLAMPLHAVLEEELSFGGPVARELPGRDGAENTPSLISRVSLNVGRVGDEAVVADGSMFLSLRTADMNCEFDPELSQTCVKMELQFHLGARVLLWCSCLYFVAIIRCFFLGCSFSLPGATRKTSNLHSSVNLASNLNLSAWLLLMNLLKSRFVLCRVKTQRCQ